MLPRSSAQQMNLKAVVAGIFLAGLALPFSACSKSAPPPAPKTADAAAAKPAGAVQGLESPEQKVCYGIGYNMGANFAKQAKITLDRDALKAGLDDGLAMAKTRISEADIQAAFAIVQQKVTAAMAVEGEKQQALANAFLEQNRKRPGVTVTASGLQYEVLTKGFGPKPKATDTVKVHYHGTFIDGKVFDSSVARGEPIEFPVTGVIPGWIEALQLMSVGDKWKLFIPPALAYGPRGKDDIPPNTALVFEVQLISIK